MILLILFFYYCPSKSNCISTCQLHLIFYIHLMLHQKLKLIGNISTMYIRLNYIPIYNSNIITHTTKMIFFMIWSPFMSTGISQSCWFKPLNLGSKDFAVHVSIYHIIFLINRQIYIQSKKPQTCGSCNVYVGLVQPPKYMKIKIEIFKWPSRSMKHDPMFFWIFF